MNLTKAAPKPKTCWSVRPSSDSNSDRRGRRAAAARGARAAAAARRRLRRRCSRFKTVAQLRQQLENFFSIGNLCKDVFLRTQMDVSGFVDLATRSRFGLIAALAADAAAELADAACGSCVQQLRRARDDRRDRRAPRVAARARRTPQQRGGSWVLGGWWRVGKRKNLGCSGG